jgi:ubiquinone/menaquinone biosynthesis C-methylase UbiE
MTISNNRYYDEFAANYEVHRHDGYHAFIDELEAELIRRHLPQELPRDGHGLTILEAGCGTGMLRKARARQLEIVQGSVTALPFADASFDLTYSFKVLAHVQQIELALSEMTRVLKPGGMLCAEFYNERSLRYLIKALKPATRTSSEFSDEAIFTRYDTLPRIKSYLPKSVSVEAVYGIRVLTPTAAVHKLPVVAPLLRALEKKAAGLPLLRNFGGFLLIVAKKVTPYP